MGWAAAVVNDTQKCCALRSHSAARQGSYGNILVSHACAHTSVAHAHTHTSITHASVIQARTRQSRMSTFIHLLLLSFLAAFAILVERGLVAVDCLVDVCLTGGCLLGVVYLGDDWSSMRGAVGLRLVRILGSNVSVRRRMSQLKLACEPSHGMVSRDASTRCSMTSSLASVFTSTG